MLRVILLLIVLIAACPAHAAPIDGFPADPKGAKVMDRAELRLDTPDMKIVYAVLYKLGGLWNVDVYSGKITQAGVDWKRVYRWKLIFQGQKYDVAPVTTLNIAQDGNKLQFYLGEVFKYHEGRVSIYLDWDMKTNRFREDFSD